MSSVPVSAFTCGEDPSADPPVRVHVTLPEAQASENVKLTCVLTGESLDADATAEITGATASRV